MWARISLSVVWSSSYRKRFSARSSNIVAIAFAGVVVGAKYSSQRIWASSVSLGCVGNMGNVVIGVIRISLSVIGHNSNLILKICATDISSPIRSAV